MVNIGSRQAGRERAANVQDVGYSKNEIEKAIRSQMTRGKYRSSDLYGNGTSGLQIADLLATKELSIDKRLTY